jgi:hypothetical protein
MMREGFYKQLSMSEYLSAEGLSKSGLSNLAISPAHYKARLLEPVTFKGADIGTAVHLLVLEPESAERKLFTPPGDVLGKNGSKATNAYKEWAAAQDSDAIILSRDDFEAAHYMRDAIIAHPAASELLSGGNPEVSMLWTDGNGIRRKCRPDYLNGNYIDIKTARSAKPEVFGKQAYDLHYHWSAAWTIEIGWGLNAGIVKYYFVVVEKETPWAVSVFETPQNLIDLAREEIAPIYATYRACVEYDTWPGYGDDVQQLEFPRWVFKKQREE